MLKSLSPRATYSSGPASRLKLLSISRRKYAWNPFKVTTIEEGPPEEGIIDDAVIDAAQELRNRDLSPQRLKEILKELAASRPGRRNFGLMGDVIKKLSTTTTPQFEGGEIIPLFDEKETFLIFSRVIDNISKDNFDSARFIPRLYLQLLDRGGQLQDDDLLLDVFIKFVQYLSVLGYSDQLHKVAVSFLMDHPRLRIRTYERINELFEQLNENFHPCLLIKIVDAYDYIYKGQDKLLSKLKKKVLRSIKVYLISKTDDIFAIDPQEIAIFKDFFITYSTQSNSLNTLISILECCSENDPAFFQEERTRITSKIISILINEKNPSLKLPKSIKLCQALIAQNETGISKNEILQAGSRLVEDISLKLQDGFNSEAFKTLILWDVYKNSKLTSRTQEEILKNHEIIIDTEFFNSIILALVNANCSNFEHELNEINEFFSQNFRHLDKNLETFEILILKYIREGNYQYIKDTFEASLEDGINWEEKPSVLFLLLTALTQEPGVDARTVFKFYRKVKVFCEFLNSDSYSSFMSILLKQDCIDTALDSFQHELPTLEKGSKFSVDNYPKLYQVVYDWMLNDCQDVQNAWDIYSTLMKYFELPFDSYLPIMKKFINLDRPDASNMIFQQLKRIHRTTGKLPPPTPEMYIYLFDNFGTRLYDRGVEELHMMLKVDLDINGDINIMNSILNSYTNLREFQKVSDIFDQIVSIPHNVGLNNDTVSIMLKAYTFLDLQLVAKFWNNLNDFSILPDSSNLNQYVIAHCYHEKYEEAFEIVQNCENHLDIPVTGQILEGLYKWTNSSELREKIDHWALQNHESLWKLVDKNQLVLFDTEKEADTLGISKEQLNLIRGA
jgi:hypothetical protein